MNTIGFANCFTFTLKEALAMGARFWNWIGDGDGHSKRCILRDPEDCRNERGPHLTSITGRGVVATRGIPARNVVETSPVLVMPLEDLDPHRTTVLAHYTL